MLKGTQRLLSGALGLLSGGMIFYPWGHRAAVGNWGNNQGELGVPLTFGCLFIVVFIIVNELLRHHVDDDR